MGQHTHSHSRHHELRLADLLTLDAEVLGSYLGEVTSWLVRLAPRLPATVVDIGAGTGAGSLALAREFPAAQVVAIDRSALMLDRVRSAADERGLADHLSVLQADVDEAWPRIAEVDVAWAASSLHELADPDRVLRDVRAALNPGGLLVVVEMDHLPRFLPDDIGLGRPGLEARCHQALAEVGWNAFPDWRPHLEAAGFDVVAERVFTVDATSGSAGRYADMHLRHIRSALHGHLAGDDLDTLDRLLAEDGSHALLPRSDLTVRGSRTAWAARRP